jgi:hypothetical protein
MMVEMPDLILAGSNSIMEMEIASYGKQSRRSGLKVLEVKRLF